MRGLSHAPIAAWLALIWFTHTSVADEQNEGRADDLYDNVITVDDFGELFFEYLVESGLSEQDGRRIADSAREGLKKCFSASPDQAWCFRNVLQEHSLSEAMQWIAARIRYR